MQSTQINGVLSVAGQISKADIAEIAEAGFGTIINNRPDNEEPGQLDHEAAAKSEFGKPLVNSVFTFGLMIGVSVNDTTLGTLVANLGYDKLTFPKPVFVGDTLRSESECIAVRESNSRPNAGIVTWAHRSFNQRGELVCECTRSALLLKKPA